MEKVVFLWDGWEPIFRILIVGTLSFLAIVFIIRISGKRNLASMNAFDFIITIALGSSFGRILTAKTVSLSETLITFLLLVSLQYIFSHFSARSKFFHNIVTSEPALLYYNGKFLEKNLKKENLRKEDLLGAARKKKFNDLGQVEAIVLETDGSFSVIGKSAAGERSTVLPLVEKENLIS